MCRIKVSIKTRSNINPHNVKGSDNNGQKLTWTLCIVRMAYNVQCITVHIYIEINVFGQENPIHLALFIRIKLN